MNGLGYSFIYEWAYIQLYGFGEMLINKTMLMQTESRGIKHYKSFGRPTLGQ